MPRLPDEVIEKLKTEISLLRLIESLGVPVISINVTRKAG